MSSLCTIALHKNVLLFIFSISIITVESKKKPKVKSAGSESPGKERNQPSSQEEDSLPPLDETPPPIPPQMIDNKAVEKNETPEHLRKRSNGEAGEGSRFSEELDEKCFFNCVHILAERPSV